MIQDRILELAKAVAGSATAFAARIGAPQAVIHGIVSGRRSAPRWETLEKILVALPEVSSEWLTRGIEPMFLDEEKQRAHEEARAEAKSESGSITQVTVTGGAKKIIGTQPQPGMLGPAEAAELRASLIRCQELNEGLNQELRRKNDKIIELLENQRPETP